MENNQVALIGCSGVFPEAENLYHFYENLKAGKDSVRKIGESRIRLAGSNDLTDYQVMGFVDDLDFFDPSFFNISKADAIQMDISQKFLLKLTAIAIENAGYNLDEMRGTSTGVFMGSSPYLSNNKSTTDASSVIGNLGAMGAGRIAYHFDFHGPALVIDTSCSSSLVAVHEACKSIISGECEYAIVGSFKVLDSFIEISDEDNLGILSSDGKTRAFDAESSGTGWGEGGGVLVLKSMTKAITDEDNIQAIILGSAVNQDGGRSNGITSPSPVAQEEVIKAAWYRAAISSDNIGYIEAHGTGTKIGDPIEIRALNRAFVEQTNRKGFCPIGTVKSNIGHLDYAAGIAGIIKTVLSLKNKVIFPTVHYRTPNPLINFDNGAVFVNQKFIEWESLRTKRTAAVSSFGFSGTNAHIVVQEHTTIYKAQKENNGKKIVKITAKSKLSLDRYIEILKKFINSSTQSLSDIIYTLNTGRPDYKYRFSVVFENKDSLLKQLQIAGSKHQPVNNEIQYVVALFSGEYIGQKNHEELYGIYEVYKTNFDHVTSTFACDSMYLNSFASSYSLFQLIESFGIKPTFIIGSGVGGLINKIINKIISWEDLRKELRTLEINPPNESKLKTFLESIKSKNAIIIEFGVKGEIGKIIEKIEPQRKVENILDPAFHFCPAEKTADLYCSGLKIDWRKFHALRKGRRIELPTYPFEEIRCGLQEKEKSIDNWFYGQKYIKSNIVGRKELEGLIFLLFMDSEGLGNELEKELKKKGKIIIKVGQGKSYVKHSETQFTIDPNNPLDFANLCSEIPIIDRIIYLFSFIPADLGEDFQISQIPSYAIYTSYFNFLRGFSDKLKDNLALTVVISNSISIATTQHTTCSINVFNHAFWGLQKEVTTEYPGVRLNVIDFDIQENKLRNNAVDIVNEMECTDKVQFVAYRKAQKYIEEIFKIPWDYKYSQSKTTGKKIYLITGGATGLGLAIAKSVANKDASHIIILGRTKIFDVNLNCLTKKQAEDINVRRRAVSKIQEIGVKVFYYSVDVSDHLAMRNIFDDISVKFNRIDCVVHAAVGELLFLPILHQNCETLKDSIGAKVHGTLILDELTKPFVPSYFIMFSSLTSIFPHINSNTYVIANSFMNGYALQNNNLEKRYISLCWPGWNDVGQAAKIKSRGLVPKINVADGVDAFFKAITLPNAVIAIANISEDAGLSNQFFIYADLPDKGKVLEPLDIGIESEIKGDLFNQIKKSLLKVWKEVLLVKEVADTDEFFYLGGHSLNGTQVINRIARDFDVVIEMEDIFDFGTLNALSQRVLDLIRLSSDAMKNGTIQVVEKEYYYLSHSQRRIWIMSLTDEGNIAYNMKSVFIITGQLDVGLFKIAILELIKRHETLRTVFILVEGEPRQKIISYEFFDFKIEIIDLLGKEPSDPIIMGIIKNESEIKFDLEYGPLLRAKLVITKTNQFVFIFCIHHIICDAWSMGIIFTELLTIYNSYKQNLPLQLGDLTFQYKDYAEWQQQRTISPNYLLERNYWGNKLSGQLPADIVPAYYPRPSIQTFEGDVEYFSFENGVVEKIREQAVRQNSTTFLLMLSVFKSLLYTYSKSSDLIIGTDFSGRTKSEFENIIGMFVNPIIMRTHPSSELTWKIYFEEIKKTFLEASKHQEYQFDNIVSDIITKRDLSRNPIFDLMFVMQNYESIKIESTVDLKIEPMEGKLQKSQFDISFVAVDNKELIWYYIKYNTQLFRKEDIQIMAEKYNYILSIVMSDPDTKLGELTKSVEILEEEQAKTKKADNRAIRLDKLKKSI